MAIKLSNIAVLSLCRLAAELAERFDLLGVDESGQMHPEDKRLLGKTRKQIDKVLTCRG